MSKSKKEDADLKFATKVRAVFGTGNVQKRQDAFSLAEFRETQTEFVEDAFPSLLAFSSQQRPSSSPTSLSPTSTSYDTH